MRTIKLIAIVGALAVFFAFAANTQEKQAAGKSAAKSAKSTAQTSAEDTATKSRGGEGSDPNVKQGPEVAKNQPGKEPPAPVKKGGEKSRGYSDCLVTVDSYTPWWIEVYIDGTYRGQVSPWGDGTVNALAGETRVYARAPGVGRSWGPRVFDCPHDGHIKWTLRQ